LSFCGDRIALVLTRYAPGSESGRRVAASSLAACTARSRPRTCPPTWSARALERMPRAMRQRVVPSAQRIALTLSRGSRPVRARAACCQRLAARAPRSASQSARRERRRTPLARGPARPLPTPQNRTALPGGRAGVLLAQAEQDGRGERPRGACSLARLHSVT
jgi:hypothetical protein